MKKIIMLLLLLLLPAMSQARELVNYLGIAGSGAARTDVWEAKCPNIGLSKYTINVEVAKADNWVNGKNYITWFPEISVQVSKGAASSPLQYGGMYPFLSDIARLATTTYSGAFYIYVNKDEYVGSSYASKLQQPYYLIALCGDQHGQNYAWAVQQSWPNLRLVQNQ